jgi:hypothetical protein
LSPIAPSASAAAPATCASRSPSASSSGANARGASISASEVAAWNRRSAGPSRSAAASRDRGVLAHRGHAVVEPPDQVRQRRLLVQLAERGARLGAHLGAVVVERADQRVGRAPLLGRLGDLAEVGGGGAGARAAPRQVAQRGLERDRRAREQERHGA